MHPVLRAVADRHLGLFTAADARRVGYQPQEVRRLVASRRWVRLRRGVYLCADELAAHEAAGRRHQVDCLAALLALGRSTAVVSHASAARLWQLPVPREVDGAIVRLTDPGPWRKGAGYLVSEAPLHPGDRARLGPIPLTSAARTLVDTAREWRLEDAVIAMDAALLARHTTKADLDRATTVARNWAGGASAARAVALADGRAESALETRGRLRMIGAGLPLPALQVEIRTGARLVAVVDAWFDDAAVAVEFDGKIKYTNPWRDPSLVLWEEKRREDDLRSLDIRVVRIIDPDLGPNRWPEREGRLRELLTSPGPARRRFTAVPRSRGLQRTGS